MELLDRVGFREVPQEVLDYVTALTDTITNTLGLENTFNDLRDCESRVAKHEALSEAMRQSIAIRIGWGWICFCRFRVVALVGSCRCVLVAGSSVESPVPVLNLGIVDSVQAPCFLTAAMLVWPGVDGPVWA
jgi:hypothetical protein